MSSPIFSLSPNQSLLQEGIGLLKGAVLPFINKLVALEDLSGTDGKTRAIGKQLAQCMAPVVSLAVLLKDCGGDVLDEQSFNDRLKTMKIFNDNPVLSSDIRGWQSTLVKGNSLSVRDKEQLFAVAMRGLEGALPNCKKEEKEQTVLLAKYILSHHLQDPNLRIRDDDSDPSRELLKYAKKLREVSSGPLVDVVLNKQSFEQHLQTMKILNDNPACLSRIRGWQSTLVKGNSLSVEDKELAFAVAMQGLEGALENCNETDKEQIVLLGKYILSHHQDVTNLRIHNDNSEKSRLLRYAKDLRATVSSDRGTTFSASPVYSRSGVVRRQSTEQALKQLMSMCSASSSEKPMSSDNFGYAVEELKKTIFPDQISDYDGKLYEQKVIKHLREWGKANQAVNSCDRQKEEPYLKLRLELLTSMVLQEILQSTDNDMEPFKDKKELLQILDFMMKQPVTTSKEKQWLLPMFSQPGRHSWNPFNSNPQMPDDTQPHKSLLSAFNDSRTEYQLSRLQSSVAQDYLNISRNTRAGHAEYLIQK